MKHFSAGVFVLIALSFLLPFVAASCNGQRVVQLTGLELVTGTSVQTPSSYGYASKRSVDPEPLAVIAFIAILAGIAFAFVKGRAGNILSVLAGAVGFISLLLLQSKLNSDAAREGASILQLDFLAGFWIALVLLLVSLTLNGYLIAKKTDSASATGQRET